MKSFKHFLSESIPKHYGTIIKFREHWNKKGVQNSTVETASYIRPQDIKIEPSEQGKGLGTAFMEDLCKYADWSDLQIRLSPSDAHGASSISRLVNFYKRFGFVENKGKNKNLSFSETMYRNPQQGD